MPGAVVKRVTEGSPGYRQGVVQGDIIRQFSRISVDNKEQFLKCLKDTAPGDVVWIEMIRDGRTRMLMLTVGSRQNNDLRALQLKAMGVVTENDVKLYQARVPGDTAGAPPGGVKGHTSTLPPGGVTESMHGHYQTSDEVEMASWVGSSEELLATIKRAHRKIASLMDMSSKCTEILQDPKSIPEQVKKMKTAQKSLKELRPYLGITVEAVAGQGVSVTRVSIGSPGERQGIKKGDVICKVNGTPVPNVKVWLQCIRKVTPGNVVMLEIVRGSGRHAVALVEVGTRRLSFDKLHSLHLRTAGLLNDSNADKENSLKNSSSSNEAKHGKNETNNKNQCL